MPLVALLVILFLVVIGLLYMHTSMVAGMNYIRVEAKALPCKEGIGSCCWFHRRACV